MTRVTHVSPAQQELWSSAIRAVFFLGLTCGTALGAFVTYLALK